MAYWWVSQNKSYRHERKGEYLWAPKQGKGGITPHHWLTMTKVEPGDIVFSFVRRKICAISVAQSEAFESPRPAEFSDKETWGQEGYKISAIYDDVDPPLAIEPFAPELYELLTGPHSPLTKNLTGNQGYLYAIPDRAGQFLLAKIGREGPADIASDQGELAALRAIERSELPHTEKEALAKSRIGQGQFRKDLMDIWNGRCAISNVTIPSLLRASHIKPWRSSNNYERLDPYNGLLLAAQYDAAFDAGLVSFDDTGNLIASTAVDHDELAVAGIIVSARLKRVDEARRPYLQFHRENVLKN